MPRGLASRLLPVAAALIALVVVASLNAEALWAKPSVGAQAVYVYDGSSRRVDVPRRVQAVGTHEQAVHGQVTLSGARGHSNDDRSNVARAFARPGDAASAPRTSAVDPLPAGADPYQLQLFPTEPYNRTLHYGRTPTTAQRQAMPAGMEFDHTPPLVQHYYEGPGGGRLQGFNLTQAEREAYARSLSSGVPATPADQRAQGGYLSDYSKKQKEMWGL